MSHLSSEEEKLFTAFREQNSEDALKKLVELYIPLVQSIARRFVGKGEFYEDLVQVGCIGLIKGMKKFDPKRGVVVSTYIVPTVAGEIRRCFRDRVDMIRIPRGLRELQAPLAEARQELSRKGHKPTYQDLAHYIGVPLEDVVAAIAASEAQHVSSLDKSHFDDEEGTLLDAIGVVDDSFDRAEYWTMLEPIIPVLDERERIILYQRFFLDMSQTEIAAEIGVSQMHVSRLLRKVVNKLVLASDAGVKLPKIRPRETTTLNNPTTGPTHYKVKTGAKRAKMPETPKYRVKVGAKRARK